MKAVYFTEHGGSDVLTYGDLPEPDFGPNDVKVRVRACALNRLDVFTRLGVRGHAPGAVRARTSWAATSPATSWRSGQRSAA